MLDLLITYFNFFIIAIKYIVKIIAFQPPNPKGYRIINSNHEIQNNSLDLNPDDIIEILFLITNTAKNENNSTKNDQKTELKTAPKKRKCEYRPAPIKISEFQLIYFENEDNNTKIPAFLFKPKETDYHYMLDCIIIYCHGNSGDIGTSFIECQILTRNICCNVLCFEYPGYGLSTDINNTNEKRSYYNIRQAYKYARDKLHYKPENIIIYGFSLGTGIAFDLACDKNYPIGGVILQSAFLSIIRTIYNFKKTYYFDLFNNCDKAKFCCSKVFFIHGDKDTIVPYVHGRILAKLIPKKYFYKFYTVTGANHNDIIKFGKEKLYLNIYDFIKSLSVHPEIPQPNPDDDNLSDYDFSSIKDIDIKPSHTFQDLKHKNKNEYEKKVNYDMNTINNNITSNDELNSLKKDNENNNNNCFNVSLSNKNNNSNRKEIKKDDNSGINLNNENMKNSCIISKSKENNTIIEEPKFLDSKDIKINIDNYNLNAKTNLNTMYSKNDNTDYKNDFSISFNNNEDNNNN